MAVLNSSNVEQYFDDSAKIQKRAADNYREYERIARGLPRPEVRDPMPKITEKTTATILREIYKRACPDLPTVSVEMKNEFNRCLVEYKLNKHIIPSANEQYPILQKCQMAFYMGGIYGSQFAEIIDKNDGGEYGVDFRYPHMGNCYLISGSSNLWDSPVAFTETFWSTEELQRFVDEEEATIEETGKDSEYNLRKLKKALKDKAALYTGSNYGDISLQFEALADADNNSGNQIRIIKATEKGADSKTYWLIKEGSIGVVAELDNSDYGGMMPMSAHYHEYTPLSPFGIGVCETLIGDQNAADTTYQYKYRAELNALLPTILAKAIDNFRALKLGNGALVNLGSNPDADIKVMQTDTSAIATYNTDNANKRTNMRTSAGLPDTDSGTEYGLPGRSRTPAGVDAVNNVVQTILNTVRKNFEVFFGHTCKLMLYKWLSNTDRIEDMQIDRKTFLKLNSVATEEQLEGGALFEENGKLYVKVHWKAIRAEQLDNVYMNITTDWQVDKFQRAQSLTAALTQWMTHPAFETMYKFDKIGEQILSDMGLDPYEFIVDEAEDPNRQKVTVPLVEQMIQDIGGELISNEKQQKAIKIEDLGEDAARQLIKETVGLESEDPLPHIENLRIKEYEAETKRIQAQKSLEVESATETEEQAGPADGATAELLQYAIDSGVGPEDPRLAQVLRFGEETQKGNLSPEEAEKGIEELINATA